MGLLIKHRIETPKLFVPYEKIYSSGKHFASTREPYIIGKLVMSKNDKGEFEDFCARQLQYVYRQIPGYRVLFIQAGFSQVPTHFIRDEEIKNTLDDMCNWYFETYLKNNRSLLKRLKIKNDE